MNEWMEWNAMQSNEMEWKERNECMNEWTNEQTNEGMKWHELKLFWNE
jgi:hypothetical protein